MIEANFPHSRYLSQDAAADALVTVVTAGIAGGSVYDALVGLAAKEHAITLCTGDRRAEETYRVLGVSYELIV